MSIKWLGKVDRINRIFVGTSALPYGNNMDNGLQRFPDPMFVNNHLLGAFALRHPHHINWPTGIRMPKHISLWASRMTERLPPLCRQSITDNAKTIPLKIDKRNILGNVRYHYICPSRYDRQTSTVDRPLDTTQLSHTKDWCRHNNSKMLNFYQKKRRKKTKKMLSTLCAETCSTSVCWSET